ncbi:MAG: hypothetical protein U9R15_06580, partial [Chloroflexota bacterium]|nr:hypothetical protein [Chloroflexota bacterium]
NEALVWPEEFEETAPVPQKRDAFAPIKGKRNLSFDWDADTQAQVDERLAQLHKDLAPRCILLTNRNGRVLNLQGEIGPDRTLSLAALVAWQFLRHRRDRRDTGPRGRRRSLSAKPARGRRF